MSQTASNPKAALEAILLAAPGPARVEGLAEALGLPVEATEALLAQLREDYDGEGRGFAVQAVAGGYRLVTRPEFAEPVNRFLKAPALPGLSVATLETLAIVAYRQPVTRVEIEAIRGVRVDRALTTLLERGMIRELGRKEGIGRPILYGTTPLFLEHFGLAGLVDLPGLEEVAATEDEHGSGGEAPDGPGESPDGPAGEDTEKDRDEGPPGEHEEPR
ncbi:MAG: SMC-Scp complex subunit ScpB [Bacillota bacterium]